MGVMLLHYCSDFSHLIDKVGASFIPMRYPNAHVLSVTIGVSAVEIRDHCEETVDEYFKITTHRAV